LKGNALKRLFIPNIVCLTGQFRLAGQVRILLWFFSQWCQKSRLC